MNDMVTVIDLTVIDYVKVIEIVNDWKCQSEFAKPMLGFWFEMWKVFEK